MNIGLQREIEGMQEKARELGEGAGFGTAGGAGGIGGSRGLPPGAFNADNVLKELQEMQAKGLKVLGNNAVATVTAAEAKRQDPKVDEQAVSLLVLASLFLLFWVIFFPTLRNDNAC